MNTTEVEINSIASFIGGEWNSDSARRRDVINPANGKTVASVPYVSADDVDRAARFAHETYLSWRDVPVVDRVQPLYRFKTLLEQNQRDLATSLTIENGKTLDDSLAEVRRGIQMVEVACGMPSLMMGDSLNNVAKDIDCRTIRQPLGVCAGITPFNFPAMVPLWMYPFAIACGNTFLLKPSEKVPITPTRIAQLLLDSGLPKGVFQILHGDKVAVDALLDHPLVKAVSFVGSTPVAKYIYERSAARGKRVQALGGAKNHLVVMPDANIPKAVDAIISSAFGAAGERCLAGSVLVPVGEAAGPLLDALVKKTSELRVGDGLQSSVEMGPVIDSAHRRKILGYIEQGIAEGAELICDGRLVHGTSKEGAFVGPTIFDRVNPEMTIAREEIFGPVLSVIRTQSLEEAIALINTCEFGNTTTIYTQSGKAAREFQTRVDVGMVGVNLAVAAPMAFFPFAGWKSSFFGDLHAHGKDAVAFYSEQKVLMTRWF